MGGEEGEGVLINVIVVFWYFLMVIKMNYLFVRSNLRKCIIYIGYKIKWILIKIIFFKIYGVFVVVRKL